MEISHFRRDYLKGGLKRENLDSDPVKQFADWLSHARDTDIADPTAMVLATVGENGQPSQCTVLLKYFDEKGDKTIVPDPDLAPFITKMFELYATGVYSFRKLRDELTAMGARTKGGKVFAISQINKILKKRYID